MARTAAAQASAIRLLRESSHANFDVRHPRNAERWRPSFTSAVALFFVVRLNR
jgi:hypothetical protein